MAKHVWDYSPIDIKLKLLCGDQLPVGSMMIKPKTVREIKEISFERYSQFLGIVSLKTEDFFEEIKESDRPEGWKNLNPFQVILLSGDHQLIQLMIDSFKFFLNEEEVFVDENFGLVFGSEIPNTIQEAKYVSSDNYYEIIEVIKFQNCLSNPETDVYNPADEGTRALIEKMKANREKVRRAKAQSSQGEDSDFSDIISSVGTKSNTYSKHTVWDLTIYQLYDEFKRLEAISSYETNILAMVNGAKIEDLKHWSSNLDND